MEEIGKSLPAVFKRRAPRDEPQWVEVLGLLWPRVAGKAVAEHSRPVAFGSGTLTLSTPCETWAAQLRQLEEEILEAVNAFLGGAVVKELRVRQAPELARPRDEIRNSKVETRTRRVNELRVSNLKFPAGLDAQTAGILELSFSKYFARREKRLG